MCRWSWPVDDTCKRDRMQKTTERRADECRCESFVVTPEPSCVLLVVVIPGLSSQNCPNVNMYITLRATHSVYDQLASRRVQSIKFRFFCGVGHGSGGSSGSDRTVSRTAAAPPWFVRLKLAATSMCLSTLARQDMVPPHEVDNKYTTISHVVSSRLQLTGGDMNAKAFLREVLTREQSVGCVWEMSGDTI